MVSAQRRAGDAQLSMASRCRTDAGRAEGEQGAPLLVVKLAQSMGGGVPTGAGLVLRNKRCASESRSVLGVEIFR